MPFIKDEKTRKIVDPERNAELRCVQGYSSGHKEWEINWDGEVFSWMALDTITYGGERKNKPVAIDWFVASMKIPESLKARRSEVMGMIKESLETQGIGGRFEGPANVKFDQRLIQ